jgi:CBS domain-containing protein
MQKGFYKEQASKETFVHEIMDKELITITPADKIDDCMEMSTKKSDTYLLLITK